MKAAADAVAKQPSQKPPLKDKGDLVFMLDTQTVDTAVEAPLTTHQRLVAAFTPVETTQIDNSEPAPDPAPEVQAPEPIAEPVEESATAPEKDAEPKADELDEADAADTDEELADFNALNEGKKYETADELKQEFPRSPAKLIARAAQLSLEAKAGHDLKVKLGGEPFIEPIVKIAQGLQDESPDKTNIAILNGVMEAKGQEALISFVAQSVYMAFADPSDTSDFGLGMKVIADSAIQERFGEGVMPDRIAKLAEWESYGWFEKLDKWTQDGFVDEDELAQLIEINSNPRLKQILAENAELKRKVETAAPQRAAAQEPDFANTLNETAETKISDVLSTIVWAKSPLREIASDKDEIKQDKADFRKSLTDEAISHFSRNASRKSLIEGLRRGQQGTAAWQSQLVKAINDSIIATQPSTKKAEERLAKMYANTRNGNLVPKTPAPVEKQAPTVTTPAPVQTEVRSVKDIRANLAAAYERQAAGAR